MYSTAAGRHVGHVIFHYTASTCCVHAQALYIKHHINMPCIDYVFSHLFSVYFKEKTHDNFIVNILNLSGLNN